MQTISGDQVVSLISEGSNSETVKVFLSSGSPVDEKCGGKNMSKCAFSAISSGASSRPIARRSTYSKTHPSRRKESVASPRRERTCQVESEPSEIVPPIAQATCADSKRKSSEEVSSAHFLRIRSALPESIILPSEETRWLHTAVKRIRKSLHKKDCAMITP